MKRFIAIILLLLGFVLFEPTTLQGKNLVDGNRFAYVKRLKAKRLQERIRRVLRDKKYYRKKKQFYKKARRKNRSKN